MKMQHQKQDLYHGLICKKTAVGVVSVHASTSYRLYLFLGYVNDPETPVGNVCELILFLYP
jgi:hypothetical protein